MSLQRNDFKRPADWLRATLLGAVLLWPVSLSAKPVAVRYSEGSLHGFVMLRGADEKVVADGDVIQTVRGDRVTTHLIFHFKDGSLQDETTVYSQHQRFRLVRYDLTQKGPSFPQPLEMSVDGATGQATVRYTNEKGEKKVESEKFDVPDDLANGMVSTLLKNARSNAPPASVSLIAATPKPRLVKLAISAAGQTPFSLAGARRQATHYVLKVEIGGLAGVLAPLFGKQPPDSHVWISGGELPAFVRAEQPLFAGSSLYSIELATPIWQRTPPATSPPAERVASTRGAR